MGFFNRSTQNNKEDASTEVSSEKKNTLISRRSFLRVGILAALSTKLPFNINPFALIESTDKVALAQLEAEKEASQAENLIDEPSQEELFKLKEELDNDLDTNFTASTEKYIKGEFEITRIKATTEDGRSNYAIHIKKVGVISNEAKRSLVYFHSIEGPNYDLKAMRNDFDEIWDSGGEVILPIINRYSTFSSSNQENDNFLDIEDAEEGKIDLTKTDDFFDSNTPIGTLRALNAVYEQIPELKDFPTEIVGVSLGGSTALATLSMWQAFEKRGNFLPKNLKDISLYAPIASLFDRKLLKQIFVDKLSASTLGPHIILKELLRSSVIDYAAYRKNRFSITQGVAPTQVIDILKRIGKYQFSKSGFAIWVKDNGDELRGVPEKEIIEESVSPYNPDSLRRNDDFTRLRKEYQGVDVFDYQPIEENINQFDVHPIASEMARRNLMMFSPKYLLQVMREFDCEFPTKSLDILYAGSDNIVAPRHTINVIDALDANSIDFEKHTIIGGHILNHVVVGSLLGAKGLISYLRNLRN